MSRPSVVGPPVLAPGSAGSAVAAAGGATLLVAALAAAVLGVGGGTLVAGGAQDTGLLPAPAGPLGTGVWRELALVVAAYALTLATARGLTTRAAWAAVLAAHAVLLAGPILISQDVFNYLDYARLGVLHHLDPYTHGAIAAPRDPVFGLVGWRQVASAYGPLFTLLSYPTAWVGVLGGVWALKLTAVASSLGAVALTARCARRLGRPEPAVVAAVGLNPILLVWAVGGAHNDLLLLAALMAGVAAALAGRPGRAGAAVVAAAAIKLSGAVALPFLLLRRPGRGRMLAGAALALLGLAAVSVPSFGVHALGFLAVLRAQQARASMDSLPVQLAALAAPGAVTAARLEALHAALLGALAYVAWRAHRGGDWLSGLGWGLLLTAVLTPWYLPWYAIWPLPVAALCRDRRVFAALLAVQVLVLVNVVWPALS